MHVKNYHIAEFAIFGKKALKTVQDLRPLVTGLPMEWNSKGIPEYFMIMNAISIIGGFMFQEFG